MHTKLTLTNSLCVSADKFTTLLTNSETEKMENNNNVSRNEEWRVELRGSISPKERAAIERVEMPQLDPAYRITCNEEVNQGITEEQAVREATRCLDCNNPQCVTGCPVGIDIPKFIKNIERRHFADAAATLKETSSLPAVCGRVCPQEKQCESKCIRLKMKQPAVAIGYLERFAADWQRNSGEEEVVKMEPKNGIKVAVVGSGPSGLSFAGDMAKKGFDVTVFEALHEIGGVLKYGIPEFRLPNAVVDHEIEGLRSIFLMNFGMSIPTGQPVTHCGLLQSRQRVASLTACSSVMP